MPGGDVNATSDTVVNLAAQQWILVSVFLCGKSAFYLAAASIQVGEFNEVRNYANYHASSVCSVCTCARLFAS